MHTYIHAFTFGQGIKRSFILRALIFFSLFLVFQEVQILKALILGEEERGQSQYQVMCFVFHFSKDAFISSDAMSKLRQKNPGTVRTPEEDRGRENYTMNYSVDVTRAGIISPHIPEVCSEAIGNTYTRQEDVQMWSATQ
ncbi:PREDICTED: out at first protein-like, partial [Nicrophorus vespilloides]|uniref:Out at first protein-like n=1 Tax=Nicrophorus vespilloides TaxID=110193 RepID=A0ABM1M8V6_NICVS